MGYTTTYNDLVTELGTYCEDDTTEYQTELPNIIARAEDRVQDALNLDLFVTFAPFTITIAVTDYVRPTGLKLDGFFYSDGGIIERRAPDFCKMFTGTGRPKFFGELSETQIVLAPTPDTGYSATSKVLSRLTTLSVSNQSNWVAANCADLLFLAALIESEAFLQAPERITEFKANWQATLGGRYGVLQGLARAEYVPPAAQVSASA